MEKIKVDFAYLPVVNFAMQQNRTKIIQSLKVENLSNEILKNIEITISSDPQFGYTNIIPINALTPSEKKLINTLEFQLSTAYFTQLSERFSGQLNLRIAIADEVIFTHNYPIDVLPYDQWGGVNVLPEMISAFVTPNHPAITPIIKRASAILDQWTANPSFDEYQSRNPDRVRKQIAAIYTAISEQNIIYNAVPASFEEYGQRIRMADIVMNQKLGNCLDMSVLYATCLESVGIHPLIILVQGHAFAGGWLIPETFPDNIIDDLSFLTKRTADGINDIALIELTSANLGNTVDFDQAVKLAAGKLKSANEFILAVDVKRSRFSGIRPLPQRILNGQSWEIESDNSTLPEKTHDAPENINPYDLSGISEGIIVTKQLLWERKLLDLSLRNNLLNIRITKNTLQIVPADLHLLEDALTGGDEFRILHKPTDWEAPSANFNLYQSIQESDPIIELIRSEITQKRLRSYFSESELSKALTHLYRTSRLSIEENGANTLYLTLGLLRWYETSASERPRYAPILLFPVEIIRKSAAKGFVIKSREEGAMMNITLLEMLRQNFGISISGLDPLPEGEIGVDLKRIFSIIRNGIKDQKKWDVEEQAILGIFSFNKFIMWNDIHSNSHKLMENHIVSSLMNGKIEWDINDEMVDATQLEKELSPAEIVLPISADSSQLEAVYEAVNGTSFVLHGPPGTGKSQTITNIIANALYRGKRVLFVAEKMAALSVVQSRLAAIGLAPFCLELHSNKMKKSAVLSQLKESTEVVKFTPPEEFGQEAARLLNLRSELNVYIEALHKKYPFGLSAYDAITRSQIINADYVFDFPITLFNDLTKEQITVWDEAVADLVSTGNACGHPHNHPLEGIKINSYSSSIKEEALQCLKQTEEELYNIKTRMIILSELFEESGSAYDKNQLNILIGIIDRLFHIPELTPSLLSQPQLNELLDEMCAISVHGQEKEKLKNSITENFSEQILDIDAKTLLLQWNQVSEKWFLSRHFGQKTIRKQINVYSIQKTIENEGVKNLLNLLIKYQAEEEFVGKQSNKISSFFGKYGRKDNENWDSIDQIIKDTSVINSLILKISGNVQAASKMKESLSKQLTEGIETFRSLHGPSLSELNGLMQNLATSESRLSSMLGITHDTLYNSTTNWLDPTISKLKAWQNNIDKLKDWYQWLKAGDKLQQMGIGFVADKYKTENLPTDLLHSSFMKSFYQAVVSYIISNEPDLELFKGKIFNDVIEKYKKLTANFQELVKKELYSKLASNIPSFTREAAQNSEVGILQKNIKNNARGMSIRKLFDQAPTLLARMCPCMLMSPISVAQYIDPEAEKFDLIVFDEASQMPTYEAIGAIARGRNIVVVGDPKQMPPTNFFSTNSVDEENIEMEDLESILDDFLALSIPSKYLLWHYRSKHESLISFSNSEYYDNKLLTFPSPDNIESKVKLVYVDGFYDKGKSRQNKKEAQAVVDEIARRLRDENLRKRSIGVVTFSSVQQTLIEDLLSDLFVLNPDIEKFALECEEPLFIKNLENVQGDERDIILFSVGYGPDSDGRVSMNFGPLNRVGGERRLNVAVSRARYEMTIYSTLRSDQIDLNRTSSVGVAGLKRFLEYAERGTNSSIYKNVTSVTESIEHIIAQRLKKEGFEVHTNIGSSGYKIDIGIVDEKNPAKYKLGILCDGENYRHTKTMRDREIVQTSVLKQLGWNVIRIWSIDWWENPDEVVASIREAINKNNAKLQNKREIKDPVAETKFGSPILDINEFSNKSSNDLSDRKEVYRAVNLIQIKQAPETILLEENKQLLIEQFKKVVERESPISRSLLYRKIVTAWNIQRMSNKLETYLGSLMAELPFHATVHDDSLFIWHDEDQCISYVNYRPESDREAADLPPEEIANAMHQIVDDNIGVPVKDLIRLTAQLFGFTRTTANIEAVIQKGLAEAEKREYFRIENEKAIVI